MPERIKESIVVAAIFGRRPKVKPVWFVWQNQQHRIARITYTWMDKEGQAKLYHFAVSDGANLYELCYDSEQLTWRLVAQEIEG